MAQENRQGFLFGGNQPQSNLLDTPGGSRRAKLQPYVDKALTNQFEGKGGSGVSFTGENISYDAVMVKNRHPVSTQLGTVKDFNELYETFSHNLSGDLLVEALGLEGTARYRTTVSGTYYQHDMQGFSEKKQGEISVYSQHSFKYNPNEEVFKNLMEFEHASRSAFLNSFYTWS